jgi:pyruvate dehydrogenase E2 component (dihydrolipoamide acetyltransferase)
MAEKLPMLALSPTMEQGKIVRWTKKEGDTINSGDVLCEVETDKAVMEYQSPSSGKLLKIILPEGESAAVEETICILGKEGEDISSLLSTTSQTPSSPPTPPTSPTPPTPLSSTKNERKQRTSPLARNLADEAGVDISKIKGSGPEGRVVKRDVEQAISHIPDETFEPEAKHTEVPMNEETISVTSKRKVIADVLSKSKFTAPHYYLKVSVRMDELLSAREKFNSAHSAKVSLNAIFIKLTAEALKKHTIVNSSWENYTIVKHGRIDIALAVAQDDGLAVPIVRDCGMKGIAAIDSELKRLIEKAKKNQLSPDDYRNSTFTISNLGSFGIEEFTAIINPPGSAILAVGSVEKRLTVNDKDEPEVHKMVRLTLSCDHRVIDGAVGAAFLVELKSIMESPILAFF